MDSFQYPLLTMGQFVVDIQWRRQARLGTRADDCCESKTGVGLADEGVRRRRIEKGRPPASQRLSGSADHLETREKRTLYGALTLNSINWRRPARMLTTFSRVSLR